MSRGEPRRWTAGVAHVAALVTGAVISLASVLVHRSIFPLGLVLSLATSLGVAWWLLGSRWRRAAASYAVGWVALLVVVIAGRPEGDFAIAADSRGYALMAGGLVVIVLGVVSLAPRGRGAA